MKGLVRIKRIFSKLRGDVIRKLRGTKVLPFLYLSYWHYLANNKHDNSVEGTIQFYTARPNPGAGIGHQLGNWHAGLWHAKQFGLKHAHYPFSSEIWERFLGYGEGVVCINHLIEKGYKVVRLPFFYEWNKGDIELNKKIISSYKGKKILFLAEQDQRYDNQFGVMEEIRNRFYSASSRKEDKLMYESKHINIAIHVRRGDILSNPSDPSLAMRYLSNDYYYKVLTSVLNNIQSKKDVHIYFFSQGSQQDYPEFRVFKNLHWCFDMNARDSFLHMVYADLLITSKSSFSYKPALLNKGIKVCPRNFWHSYPSSKDWIMADDEGNIIDKSMLTNILSF